MSNTVRITIFLLLALAQILPLIAGTAHAYVGPGPGLTVLGALWAVIAAVLLAILAIVRWPLRYLLRKLKGDKGNVNATGTGASDDQREEPGDDS